MKNYAVLFTFLFLAVSSSAQISAKLMRYLDVSDTQITFVYGGDLWIMPKAGGSAMQITHSPGEESCPKF
jgi:tricorn protease